nr:hypothetical protein [uncultured bacterium]
MFSKNKTIWIKSALLYFFVAALLGALLRFAFVFELPEWIQYKNIQHAHSHVAMMGWLTAAFYAFSCWFFKLDRPIYRTIFWASQATVLGMLISFPIQGYAFFSIFFSTAFMIVIYFFIYAVLKDLRQKPKEKDLLSTRFLKTALFFLGLSTLGLWTMGPIMASSLRGTAYYYGAVQFFLHFQFNGWFVFVLLGILFKVFEANGIPFNRKMGDRFYLFLFISCFLTFALAIAWSTPSLFLFLINSIGVLFQTIALIYFLMILKDVSKAAKKQFTNWHFFLWGIAFFCLTFKMFIQNMVAIPYLATISYTIHNFVIGFIHLLMLGALSTFLLGLMTYLKWEVNKWGVRIFLMGLVLTEVLLFGQGLLIWAGLGFIPNYHLVLALASLLLPVGVGVILFRFKATLQSREAEKSLGS